MSDVREIPTVIITPEQLADIETLRRGGDPCQVILDAPERDEPEKGQPRETR